MPTPDPFFLYPFAEAGDTTAIPNTGGSTGPVNYQYGFTPNYELNILTNPSAIPIPRQQMNQLFFDITTALQQYQSQGTYPWVAPGSGGPANYPIFARTLYNGQVWESQVATNTSVPGADANWLPISGLGAMMSSRIVEASAIPVLTADPTNVTSLILPIGNWNVYGNAGFTFTGDYTQATAWVSTTSLAIPDLSATALIETQSTGGGSDVITCPFFNVVCSAPTEVYLSVYSVFSTGTCNSYGALQAQRV